MVFHEFSFRQKTNLGRIEFSLIMTVTYSNKIQGLFVVSEFQ